MAVWRYVIGTIIVLGLTATCWAGSDLDQMSKLIVDATQRIDNTAFISSYFARDLASKLRQPGAADPADGIDFDVFTYAQDPDYEQIRKTIRSEIKQADATNAIIRITFTQYEGDPGLIDYHLKKSAGRWLIDDVVYPNDSFSLRSALHLK